MWGTPRAWGTPQTWGPPKMGYPRTWGAPPLDMGYPPGPEMGYPLPRPDMGYPPPKINNRQTPVKQCLPVILRMRAVIIYL